MSDFFKDKIRDHIKNDIESLFGPKWNYPRHPDTEALYTTWRQTDAGKKAFKDLCQVWSGYKQNIVQEVTESIVQNREHVANIITNPDLHKNCATWFVGITCDGSRAETTLNIIHSNIVSLEYAIVQDTQMNVVKDPPKIQCDNLDL